MKKNTLKIDLCMGELAVNIMIIISCYYVIVIKKIKLRQFLASIMFDDVEQLLTQIFIQSVS